MRGTGKRSVRRGGVTHLPIVGEILFGALPDRRRIVCQRRNRIGDGREYLVIHDDRLRRIQCLLAGLCDDEGNAVTEIAHPVRDEDMAGRYEEWRAVLVVSLCMWPHGKESVGRHVGSGKNRGHAGKLLRGRGIDRLDDGVSVG